MTANPTPRLAIIVAMAKNRTIGVNNTLPWRCPEDLKHFKALTMGHHMIMGRKTFDSVGKPLPGRTNVVVTRDAGFHPGGVVVARSIEEAIAACKGDSETFIAGGAEIYRQTIERADRIYLTIVHGDFPGDTKFPEFNPATWTLTSVEQHPADDTNVAPCTFLVYDRT